MVNIDSLKIKVDSKKLLDISFSIKSSTALIGESGSGKSLTLKAILNLLPKNLKVEKDINADFDLNYQTIGFIPQNPFTSLSGMTKIKNQIFCSDEKKVEVFNLLDLPLEILEKYPSQISGGQTQRVVIAIALSRDIKFLLLDEPTTALDFENKENIINIIKSLRKNLDIKILFVTHDIDSIRDICDDIIILKSGKIVEFGDTNSVLNYPKDEYTKKLLDSSFKNKQFRN
jgi:peptide/nickel transport system ATP-binding protein